MAEITNFRGDTQPVEQLSSIDRAVQQLIVRVGDRVRKARERKGIPRRVLSERSGVSPRYLAQLEAGAGNISIGLLERVAIALDHRIEWFVGEEDPWTSDSVKVWARVSRVTAAIPTAASSRKRIVVPGREGKAG